MRRLAVGSVVCALAALPAPALAATASVSIKRVFYAAAPAEINDLTISLSGGDFVLSDSGAAIAAGPPCSGAGTTAACPSAGIIGFTVSGADEADSLRNTTPTASTLSGGDGNDSLEGGSGDDTLRGNKGIDTLSGGAGDDFIDVRGDRGDIVSCGGGDDTVRADASDLIATDCETVERPTAPPPTPGNGPDPSRPGGGLLGPVETGTLDPGACAMDRLGTPGVDLLDGTDLGDNLFGLQGDDVLRGGRNDDCLFGGAGSDRLIGGPDDDRLLGDDSETGVAGNDRLLGKGGSDLLRGGAGNDRIKGGAGNDRLDGGPGVNRLRGGSGNDRLTAVNGKRDLLNCGPGRDRAWADGVDLVRGCERVRRTPKR
ncbi:MAG TPA: calcium-binding protein [Thermoleophilaceae bacterium]